MRLLLGKKYIVPHIITRGAWRNMLQGQNKKSGAFWKIANVHCLTYPRGSMDTKLPIKIIPPNALWMTL